MVVVFLIFSVWLVSSNARLKNEINNSMEIKSSLESKKSYWTDQISQQKVDGELIKKVELATERLRIKQLLQSELENRQTINSAGFASLLNELASIPTSNMWLTDIVVINDQYRFQGFTLNAKAVPKWVENLKISKRLKGHAFSSLKMLRQEEQPISFVLESEDRAQNGTSNGGAR